MLVQTTFVPRPRFAALTCALSWGLSLAAGIQSAPAQAHAASEAGVDVNIRPGDDFFAYANGSWLEATQIPDGRPRWNARDEINELTHRQLETLIDDTARA